MYLHVNLTILTGMVEGQFTQEPQNVAAVQGREALLMCTVDNIQGSHQQQWNEYFTDPTRPSTVSQNDMVLPNYVSAFNIQGQYNLQISQAQLNYSGKYSCFDNFATGTPTKYAELIVLGEFSEYFVPLVYFSQFN